MFLVHLGAQMPPNSIKIHFLVDLFLSFCTFSPLFVNKGFFVENKLDVGFYSASNKILQKISPA
jgi:hypothetical protein